MPLDTSKALAVLVMAGCSGGCANWANPSVTPAQVSGERYSAMDCTGLRAAKQHIAARQADLAPTLIPVKDEQTREQELSQLRGEAAAIDRASGQKGCH